MASEVQAEIALAPGMFIIEPAELVAEDIVLLERVLTTDYCKTTVGQIVALAAEKKVQLWRIFKEDAYGIFVTQINYLADDSLELFLWLMVGKNLDPYTDEIMERFTSFAKSQDCKILRSFSTPAVARFLAHRTKLEPRYCVMIMEV